MLNINTEFRKGVFFIRLEGILDKYTYNDLDDVYNFIKDNDIKNVVFNLNDISFIDKKGIDKINKLYQNIVINNHQCYFIKNDIMKYFKKINIIDNELKAMEEICN